MKFTYRNDIDQLSKLTADIEEFSREYGISEEAHYALNLCLDEVFTNIISYGFKDRPEEYVIEIELDANWGELKAVVRDSGVPFNPMANACYPDTKSRVEDRQIGGLGVYFLDQYMDDVEYKREDGLNVLTLRRKSN